MKNLAYDSKINPGWSLHMFFKSRAIRYIFRKNKIENTSEKIFYHIGSWCMIYLYFEIPQ